jgi:hypothetical protein
MRDKAGTNPVVSAFSTNPVVSAFSTNPVVSAFRRIDKHHDCTTLRSIGVVLSPN